MTLFDRVFGGNDYNYSRTVAAIDEAFVRASIPAEDLLGCIHYNTEVIDADRQGKSPYDFSPAAIEEIRKIKAILDRDE